MRAFALVRGLLDPATCARSAAAFESALERARAGEVAATDWVPTGSSLRWRALPALEPETLRALEARLRAQSEASRSGVSASTHKAISFDALALDLEISWWRCQYPPALAPPHHHPHAWHQDGALGFDFGACPQGASGALRPMTTCWIALTACGGDAPGLELLDARVDRVLGLAALDDDALRATHPASAFAAPCLDAGDALVFAGDVVHRTHVARGMTSARASLELRFVRRQACDRRSGP